MMGNNPMPTDPGVAPTLTERWPLQATWERLVRQNVTFPDWFDPRYRWHWCPTLSEIRDQGICGSCWAHGATEALSDRYCTMNNITVQLSATDTSFCCTTCGAGKRLAIYSNPATHARSGHETSLYLQVVAAVTPRKHLSTSTQPAHSRPRVTRTTKATIAHAIRGHNQRARRFAQRLARMERPLQRQSTLEPSRTAFHTTLPPSSLSSWSMDRVELR